jgi:hypothetical protein
MSSMPTLYEPSFAMRALADATSRPGTKGNMKAFDYFGASFGDSAGPEGFLVDMPEDMTIGAHYHSVDQFQVFFGSPGSTYKSHPIDDVVVHYADAFTTYGPFTAGPERLKFYTLRASRSDFTGRIPEDRDRIPRTSRHRNFDVSAIRQIDDARQPVLGEVVWADLLGEHTDGLAAHLVSAGSDTEVLIPSAVGVQYVVVVTGELLSDLGRFGQYSVGKRGPGDREIRAASAAAEPLRLLILEFPGS